MKSKVGIVKYEEPFVSVKKAVELSGAFDHLKAGDRVFVKPNIVFWSRKVPMPPWGVITTTRGSGRCCKTPERLWRGGDNNRRGNHDNRSRGSENTCPCL